MNILITGSLSYLSGAIAREFSQGDHVVVLAGTRPETLPREMPGVIRHTYDPAKELFRDALASYKFDLIIYEGSREELTISADGKKDSQSLDSLVSTLKLGAEQNISRFFFISSSEIYGGAEKHTEVLVPEPATVNAKLLYEAEQLCKFFHEKHQMNLTILRPPFIYDLFEDRSFLGGLVRRGLAEETITIPASKDTSCDFLHAEDLVDLIQRVLEHEQVPSFEIINLTSGKPTTFGKLSKMLQEHFPQIKINFNDQVQIHTLALPEDTTARKYGWVALQALPSSLVKIIENNTFGEEPGEKPTLRLVREFYRDHPRLKWVELILGLILMQLLSQYTGTLIQFKYVDFRLLYVVLIGSVYGMRFGLYAASLAGLSLLFTWSRMSLDWDLLIFNIGNWFPFIVYFVAGIVTGYFKDKVDNEIEYERSQRELIFEKYQFLYDVFEEVNALKDGFREQIIKYKDSFGKMYRAARQLDTLQADAVFFQTVNVLEEIMETESLAIYLIEPNQQYLRLEASSPAKAKGLEKSITLSEYPELEECIATDRIFQNKQLLAGYPAYAAPVVRDDEPLALIALWDASFDQHSMYYFNLFKVMTNLVRDSLIRASVFRTANQDQVFFASTRIYRPQAFAKAVQIKSEMKEKNMADYQLLRIDHDELEPKELYTTIQKGLRSADLVGLWEDNQYYILLNQADKQSVELISARLSTFGIRSFVVDSEAFLAKISIA